MTAFVLHTDLALHPEDAAASLHVEHLEHGRLLIVTKMHATGSERHIELEADEVAGLIDYLTQKGA